MRRCAAAASRAGAAHVRRAGASARPPRFAPGGADAPVLAAAAATGLAVGAAALWRWAPGARGGGEGEDSQEQQQGADYGDLSYWESRYLEDREPFDWLGSFSELRPWLRRAAAGGQRCLHLGCGTSELPEEMHDAGGFGEIWNVDSSASCLEVMRQRNATARPHLRWLQADVRDLRGTFADGEFDWAVEKSVLDAVGDCGREEEAGRYVAEVARVLRPGGSFLVFSFAPPSARLRHLEGHFSCEVDVAAGQCFAYLCRKR